MLPVARILQHLKLGWIGKGLQGNGRDQFVFLTCICVEGIKKKSKKDRKYISFPDINLTTGTPRIRSTKAEDTISTSWVK